MAATSLKHAADGLVPHGRRRRRAGKWCLPRRRGTSGASRRLRRRPFGRRAMWPALPGYRGVAARPGEAPDDFEFTQRGNGLSGRIIHGHMRGARWRAVRPPDCAVRNGHPCRCAASSAERRRRSWRTRPISSAIARRIFPRTDAGAVHGLRDGAGGIGENRHVVEQASRIGMLNPSCSLMDTTVGAAKAGVELRLRDGPRNRTSVPSREPA